MRTGTPTAKNNSKYNNRTLECIELSTCTELSLTLECEKNIRNYLLIFLEKHFIVFYSQNSRGRKQNSNNPHIEDE